MPRKRGVGCENESDREASILSLPTDARVCQETVRIVLPPTPTGYSEPVRKQLPNSWRPVLVLALLGASLLTTILLALQVQAAVRNHRNATQSVLHDDAMLAADEFIRRAAVEVGYEGIYQPLLHLDEAPSAGGSGLVGPLIVRSGADLRVGGEVPSAPVAATIDRELGEARGKRRFRVVHAMIGPRPYSFVLLSEPVAGKAGTSIRGFEMRLDGLADSFRAALEKGPLLPELLAKGGTPLTNAPIRVRVRDQAGIERFSSGSEPADAVRVTRPFGDAYEGMLAGFTVDLALDRKAAPQLVSGGVPRSPLPGLIVLLGLSAGFLAAAILQLRRENVLMRLREEFISSVSHELRTPLTQIRVFAETLWLSRARSEEEQERSLRVIDREARRLSQLVENVLLFSRTTRGTLAVSSEVFPIVPLVREVLESFSPIADARQVALSSRLDGDTRVRADSQAVRQVLLNVLDNAVKYGPPGQTVRVAVGRENGSARIVIDDEGPGIPPADRERVFERFERLPRERGSAVAGAGIGLAVVRELVLRMRGRCFIAATDSSGSGTRFVVELPAEETRP
jgi:signal transduction histidine kinase